jgi:hypothetical protein
MAPWDMAVGGLVDQTNNVGEYDLSEQDLPPVAFTGTKDKRVELDVLIVLKSQP